ncbi:hypothetical protein ACHAWF_001892 [Thalassiosira exigua]
MRNPLSFVLSLLAAGLVASSVGAIGTDGGESDEQNDMSELEGTRDFDCDPSCDTCRDYIPSPLFCKSCPDGSPVTIMIESNDWGFCGDACPLCYDNLLPAESENTYWRGWPHESRSNCSDELALIPSPIPANGGECAWVQKATYLQCGCPQLPPLPTSSLVNDSSTNESPPPVKCTLCADGSEPLYPSKTVLFRGFAETTCSRLADAFAYPRLGYSVSDNILENGSHQCSVQQNLYYEECGCPKPEKHEDSCPLCWNGEPVMANYTSEKFVEYPWMTNTTMTCGEMEKLIPFDNFERDSYRCRRYNTIASELCGCGEVVTPAPTPFPSSSAVLMNGKAALHVLWSTAAISILLAIRV